jgi:toxin-antitoxin system PIN domain toxin
MIAVDTNILVYSHRRDSPWFDAASATVRKLAEGPEAWAIPWPCIYEFLGVVTHPRIYKPPTPIPHALNQVHAWMESPSLRLIGELQDHWTDLSSVLASAKVQGAAVHDARIVAICQGNGVGELWTADRDFSRFSGIRTANPLT